MQILSGLQERKSLAEMVAQQSQMVEQQGQAITLLADKITEMNKGFTQFKRTVKSPILQNTKDENNDGTNIYLNGAARAGGLGWAQWEKAKEVFASRNAEKNARLRGKGSFWASYS